MSDEVLLAFVLGAIAGFLLVGVLVLVNARLRAVALGPRATRRFALRHAGR